MSSHAARDEERLTEAVIARIANAPDPRVRETLQALVRHLHAFVREVRPSEGEWASAIDFLTRTGQMCDDRRQEFILLSDTLGVSLTTHSSARTCPGTSSRPNGNVTARFTNSERCCSCTMAFG